VNDITVEKVDSGDPAVFIVTVGDDPNRTRHRVVVPRNAAVRPAGVGDEQLIEASFEFLLAREPRESILPEFEIGLIERYFPEYPSTMRRRFGAPE
jgi:hypothetical protein